MNLIPIYVAVGFIIGAVTMGIIWYVKDYCRDSLYLKGYKRGHERGYDEGMRMRCEADALQEGMKAGLNEK